MSSPLPSASNGYLFQPDTPLSPEVFNGCFGSIKTAIDALQQVVVDYETIQQGGVDHAHDFIEASVQPAIATLVAQITGLQGLVAAAEDQLAAIQNGGVEPANITIPDAVGLGINVNLEQALTSIAAQIAATGSQLVTKPSLGLTIALGG